MIPWNHWYHCMGSTYGTWLPGDPRGFRTRHHREHVPYDYKHPPPPGMYEERFNHAKRLMDRPAVYLTPEQQQLAIDEFIKSFTKRKIELIALSMDRIHFHLLAKFPANNPRRIVGIAKRESSHYLKQMNQGPEGGLWGTRTECILIKNRAHQVSTFRYILDHANYGALTWRIPTKSESNAH